MKYFIGIDVHKKNSHAVVLDETGKCLLDKGFHSKKERFLEVLGPYAGARVLIESSNQSEWIARLLEANQFEVIVGDPNYLLMYAAGNPNVKTDRRDARMLAEACRRELYRHAHRCSDLARQKREMVEARAHVVRMRTEAVNYIRSQLSWHGIALKSCTTENFRTYVKSLELPDTVRPSLHPMLEMLAMVEDQMDYCERRLTELARQDELVQRLQTVPGVGLITALAFAALIDRADRFGEAHQVEQYIGLVPRERSSGEKRARGSISKAGSPYVRGLLVQAAWAVLHSKDESSAPMQEWAQRLAARRGKQVAIVALARRLAGILFALMRDKATFDAAKTRASEPVQPTRRYQLKTATP